MSRFVLTEKDTDKSSKRVSKKNVTATINTKGRNKEEQNEKKEGEDSEQEILVVNRTLKSKIFVKPTETNKKKITFIKKGMSTIIDTTVQTTDKNESVQAEDSKNKTVNNTADDNITHEKKKDKNHDMPNKEKQKENTTTSNINNLNRKLEKDTTKGAILHEKTKLKKRNSYDVESVKKTTKETNSKRDIGSSLKINLEKEFSNDKKIPEDIEKRERDKGIENEREKNKSNRAGTERDQYEQYYHTKVKSFYGNNLEEIKSNIVIQPDEAMKLYDNCNMCEKISTEKNSEHYNKDTYVIGKKKSEDVDYFDAYIKQQNEALQNKNKLQENSVVSNNKFGDTFYQDITEIHTAEDEIKKTTQKKEEDEEDTEENKRERKQTSNECGQVITYHAFALKEIDKELEKINEEETKIQEEILRLTDLELQLFLKKKKAKNKKISQQRNSEKVTNSEDDMEEEIENNKKEC